MRFEGLDLNLLVALDVLMETQSVTEASRRLNLSQPSVSAALGRLRAYFGDDLLVQIGRRMMPTAKGQALAPAIKEMLNFVRFRIAQADDFDALRSKRQFRIISSDYAYDILLSKALAKAAAVAPGVTFDIAPTGPSGMRQFLNGDIDLVITVSIYQFPDHPHLVLYTDQDSVICWNKGKYAQGIDAEQFHQAQHVVAVFGEERRPTVSEVHFEEAGVVREIAVQVPSFSALPAAVVGTDRIALLHRRHAKLFSALYPINYHTLPIEGPGIGEVVQWHRLRDGDAGIRWFVNLLTEEARLIA